MNRRGMTLIELLIVLLIVGVLANIALPAMTIMVRKADATHVIGDFKAVRVAVFDYYAATSTYPASTNWGEVPAPLRNELPQGFAFDYKSVQYRWRRFTLPDGLPSDPSQTVLLGLDVASSDTRLLQTIKNLYGGPLAFGSATSVTLVIE
jgi:prepilin-type N-terminal cleavage/methylation domain-containing protein